MIFGSLGYMALIFMTYCSYDGEFVVECSKFFAFQLLAVQEGGPRDQELNVIVIQLRKEKESLKIEIKLLECRLEEEKTKYQDAMALIDGLVVENAINRDAIKQLENRIEEEKSKHQDALTQLENRMGEETTKHQDAITLIDVKHQDAMRCLQKILSDEKKNEKDLFRLHDLITLFRYYFVEPYIRLPGTSSKWGDLTDAMAEARSLLEDGEMPSIEFETKKILWNSFCSVDVDLIKLSSWSKKRNQEAHTELNSAKNQEIFLRSIAEDSFIDEEANALRVELTRHLKTVKLRRKF